MPPPCPLPLPYEPAKKPFFPRTSVCSSLFETPVPQSIQIILVHLGLSLVIQCLAHLSRAQDQMTKHHV